MAPKKKNPQAQRHKDAAKKLDFEEAANLRDRIKKLRQKLVGQS